jgi:hypothetical protein
MPVIAGAVRMGWLLQARCGSASIQSRHRLAPLPGQRFALGFEAHFVSCRRPARNGTTIHEIDQSPRSGGLLNRPVAISTAACASGASPRTARTFRRREHRGHSGISRFGRGLGGAEWNRVVKVKVMSATAAVAATNDTFLVHNKPCALRVVATEQWSCRFRVERAGGSCSEGAKESGGHSTSGSKIGRQRAQSLLLGWLEIELFPKRLLPNFVVVLWRLSRTLQSDRFVRQSSDEPDYALFDRALNPGDGSTSGSALRWSSGSSALELLTMDHDRSQLICAQRPKDGSRFGRKSCCPQSPVWS